MSEKQEENPTKALYEETVEKNSQYLSEKGSNLGIFYPLLDPRVKLPENFPDIEGYIQKLGEIPVCINYNFEYMKLNYHMGNVFYIFDEKDFCYYPKSITVMDPNHFNKVETEITFDLLKDDDIPDEQIDWDTHYLINENRILKINIPDSNTGISNNPNYLEAE